MTTLDFDAENGGQTLREHVENASPMLDIAGKTMIMVHL